MGPRAARETLGRPFVGDALKEKDGISRAIYVTASGRRVVVVRIFVEKTEKVPRREIDVALERAKEVKER